MQETFTGGAQMINDGLAVICIIGVWGWILSGVGFILRVFPVRHAFEKRAAAIWGGCFLVFYTLWVAGMIRS